MTCDRCDELETQRDALAELESVLDQIHDLNVAAARAAHPSQYRRDDCPPHGIPRPKLQLVEPRCNCGFGGFHDDINPRCRLNIEAGCDPRAAASPAGGR
jgi:hypothetical protein